MTNPSPNPVYFLLVDDLSDNLLALEGLLRREGLVLLKANSGPEALELLLQHEVALAFIDVQMPDMDGFELAEIMRGTERTKHVPIIFLTAGAVDKQRRFQGYESGAVDFIYKPIEPDVLRSKADVFFELYRQRQEVAQQRDELKTATKEIARLLQESRQYAEVLRQADQRKDEFLAMLAHELRNPLAPIQYAVEILKIARPSDDDLKNSSEIISRQVAHMARLIDDLLDIARIARGKSELRKERHDLVAIVRHTAEDYRQSFVTAGIELEVKLPDASINLVCDETRLAQVTGNLLHNALKFTPADGKVVARVFSDASSNTAIVTIADTGIGLDASVKDQLFEPFAQADQALSRTKGGLGLGLALAKGLVELHGGSISAESDGAHRGSTFTIRLPLTDVPSVKKLEVPSSVVSPEDKKLRIVVVEDNQGTAKVMQTLLSRLGHTAEIAFDAAEGIKVVQEFKPDLVMSDLGLPGEMNGYEFAKTLRKDESNAKMFLVALTGYGQEQDRRMAMEAGFDKHLTKPVDVATLKSLFLSVAAGLSESE